LQALNDTSQALESQLQATQTAGAAASATDYTPLAGSIYSSFLGNNPPPGSQLKFNLGATPYELDVGAAALPAPAPGASSAGSGKLAPSVKAMKQSHPVSFNGFGLPLGAGGHLSGGTSAPMAGQTYAQQVASRLLGRTYPSAMFGTTGGGSRSIAFPTPAPAVHMTSPAATPLMWMPAKSPAISTVPKPVPVSPAVSSQIFYAQQVFSRLLPQAPAASPTPPAAHPAVSAPPPPARAPLPVSASRPSPVFTSVMHYQTPASSLVQHSPVGH
jgi:hypothetical protein